jgi:DNA-binding NtrC family response regulator
MPSALKGKRVLVVDDEVDVCDMIADELSMCAVERSLTYEDARERLGRTKYDVVILDIMGVRGHELLAEFAAKSPCVMLTAHALTPQDLKRSMVGHAVLYLPKDELGNLEEYLQQILEVKEPSWNWLFKRLDFSRWFGTRWTLFDADFFKDFAITDAEVLEDLGEGGD